MAHPASLQYGAETQRAFSLVETLVVMAMMAILATISFAGIRGAMPIWRLNAASRMLRGDLIDAKSRAAKDMREFRVSFTTDGYTIERGNARASSSAWAADASRGQVTARNISGEFKDISFVMADTDSPIIFQPTGTIDPSGGNLQAVMVNENGKERTIAVNMAGRIRIVN